MTVNEDLLSRSISHQIGLIRYGTSVVREILAVLENLDKKLLGTIPETQIQQRRVDALLGRISDLLKEGYKVVGATLKEELIELADYEVEFQAAVLRSTLPITLDITMPTSAQLAAVVTATPFEGGLLSEWVAGMEQAAFRRLRDTIRMGVLEGAKREDIVRRIRGTSALRYRDGVLQASKRGAEAIVRTAVNHVATRSREILYSENKDIISSVRWVSTLDGRTTPVCQARDGRVFPVGEGPRPPAHINCRSTTVPVMKSWRELGIDLDEAPPGTRASMDGQVPGELTYARWIKSQIPSVQDDILGPSRARLLRSGGLSVDRFVDDDGRQYTLKELRQRESKAFGKAGL